MRSARYKFDELCASISAQVRAPDIIAISETWFSHNIPSEIFMIPSYNVPIRCDRMDRRGGGTAIWLHKSVEDFSIFEPQSHLPDYCECVFVSLKKFRILLVSLYISGRSDISPCDYNNILNYLLESVDEFLNQAHTYSIIIAGDLNKQFIDNHLNTLCNFLTLTNVVTSPTRGDALLDCCLVSDALLHLYCAAVYGPPIATSDHCSIIVNPVSPCERLGTVHTVFDYRESNISLFIDNLINSNLCEIFTSSDIDKKATILQNCLLKAFGYIPSRNVIIYDSDKEWMTPLVKILINDRWNAYRDKNWPLYNHLKTKVKKHILLAKQSWAEKAERSSKDLWKVVNSLGTKKSASLDSFTGDDLPKFVNIVNDIFSKNFNVRDIDFVLPDLLFNDWSPTVTEEWVYTELCGLDIFKATGSDEIPLRLYKLAAPILSTYIAHIINDSILCKKVPHLFKIAHIIPIPKCSPPALNSLRPISLLSLPAKLLEKAVLLFVKDGLERLIDIYQFAYRSHSSTTCAIIRIHDFVTTCLDESKSKAVSLIFLDLAKAFDSVPHRLLLKKLYNFSLSNNNVLPLGFLYWVDNYLCNRFQCTRFKGITSDLTLLSSGIPQGSLIGPILFSIFVSDLNAINLPVKNGIIVKYADDTVLGTCIYNDTSIVKYNYDVVAAWLCDNFLRLNHDKSNELVIPKTNFDVNDLPVIVSRTDSMNYLGFVLNKQFNFTSHIDYICKTASKRIHCLRIIKPLVRKDQLLTVYFSTIRSILEYASPVFCHLPISLAVKLNKIQNRIIKLINCNCENFNCKICNIQTLSVRRDIASQKLFINVLKNPSHVLFQLRPRSLPSGRLEIPICKTNRRQNSFFPYRTINQ